MGLGIVRMLFDRRQLHQLDAVAVGSSMKATMLLPCRCELGGRGMDFPAALSRSQSAVMPDT